MNNQSDNGKDIESENVNEVNNNVKLRYVNKYFSFLIDADNSLHICYGMGCFYAKDYRYAIIFLIFLFCGIVYKYYLDTSICSG